VTVAGGAARLHPHLPRARPPATWSGPGGGGLDGARGGSRVATVAGVAVRLHPHLPRSVANTSLPRPRPPAMWGGRGGGGLGRGWGGPRVATVAGVAARLHPHLPRSVAKPALPRPRPPPVCVAAVAAVGSDVAGGVHAWRRWQRWQRIYHLNCRGRRPTRRRRGHAHPPCDVAQWLWGWVAAKGVRAVRRRRFGDCSTAARPSADRRAPTSRSGGGGGSGGGCLSNARQLAWFCNSRP